MGFGREDEMGVEKCIRCGRWPESGWVRMVGGCRRLVGRISEKINTRGCLWGGKMCGRRTAGEKCVLVSVPNQAC